MNRMFGIGISPPEEWTEGEEWSDANTSHSVGGVYKRETGASDDDDVVKYKIDPGDSFFIGADPYAIRDWTPRVLPWDFFIDGVSGATYSFYFGLQVGTNEIDVNLENISPWIIKVNKDFIHLGADYHRFYGLKVKDSNPVFRLTKDITGMGLYGAVLDNTPLIETDGYRLFDWELRNVTLLNITQKTLDVTAGSSNVSAQRLFVNGSGDIGVVIRSGHSDMEIIGGEIINENHQYRETQHLYHGIEIETGDEVTLRSFKVHGFSGLALNPMCEVNLKGFTSERNGAGIYFHEPSTMRDCQVNWLRAVSGDSYAYRVAKSLEANNSGCQLDENGALGVFVLEEGATVTINGGDYQFKAPLPFITALGSSTAILNNVTINGELFNETVNLSIGESWRGQKAPVVTDTIEVYANQILLQPRDHMPILANAVSIQGAELPFDSVVELENGAAIAATRYGSMRFDPREAYLHLDPGETEEAFIRYSTETNIYTHKFIVNASPEVTAKVVQPNSFSGSGWTKNGERYSASNTNGTLTASYNFEEGEIYQISLKLEGRTSGGVLPSIGSAQGQYSHYLEGTEVWLIRAPANANSVTIQGQSFTGDVLNIYVRKLIRTETPAVPLLEASVDGNNVNLDWFLNPIERLSDSSTPRVTLTGELNYAARDGYYDNKGGHYLVENAYSVGNKSALNLRGGTNLEVWRLDVLGGYTGDFEQFQTAVMSNMNYGPYFEKIQLCYVTCDLYKTSNLGNYNINIDVIVLNGGADDRSFNAKSSILGIYGQGSSDGVVENKIRTEVNHSTFIGAYRQFRIHNVGTGLVCNSDFIREDGTKESFGPTHSYSLTSIWNCQVDGIRCSTHKQMDDQVNADHTYFPTVGAIGVYRESISLLKTYPTIDDLCRVAMTDMQFQYSTNSGSTWQTLAVPDVDLPGVLGAFKRTLQLNSGTYEIRCRCLNGALVGAWSNTVLITV
jgi:hypothetical protein